MEAGKTSQDDVCQTHLQRYAGDMMFSLNTCLNSGRKSNQLLHVMTHSDTTKEWCHAVLESPYIEERFARMKTHKAHKSSILQYPSVK